MLRAPVVQGVVDLPVDVVFDASKVGVWLLLDELLRAELIFALIGATLITGFLPDVFLLTFNDDLGCAVFRLYRLPLRDRRPAGLGLNGLQNRLLLLFCDPLLASVFVLGGHF